jgi:hypothetical protein
MENAADIASAFEATQADAVMSAGLVAFQFVFAFATSVFSVLMQLFCVCYIFLIRTLGARRGAFGESGSFLLGESSARYD